jgi:hypothetical protein
MLSIDSSVAVCWGVSSSPLQQRQQMMAALHSAQGSELVQRHQQQQ